MSREVRLSVMGSGCARDHTGQNFATEHVSSRRAARLVIKELQVGIEDVQGWRPPRWMKSGPNCKSSAEGFRGTDTDLAADGARTGGPAAKVEQKQVGTESQHKQSGHPLQDGTARN